VILENGVIRDDGSLAPHGSGARNVLRAMPLNLVTHNVGNVDSIFTSRYPALSAVTSVR
jgi:hypothetical protein